ncbi:hypothetical protein B0H17DRAFT_938661, partial [Mycena rosella]
PWALPVGRVTMDQRFKLPRTDEEQIRLDLEIHCLVTYIADEEPFLVHHEQRLREEGDNGLAYQVALHRMERSRFNAQHMRRLIKLSKENGFTGYLSPGVSICRERHACPPAAPAPSSAAAQDPDAVMRGGDLDVIEEESKGKGKGEEDEDSVADAFMNILHIADGGTGAPGGLVQHCGAHVIYNGL